METLRLTKFTLKVTQMKNRKAGHEPRTTWQQSLCLFPPVAVPTYFQVFLMKEAAQLFPCCQGEKADQEISQVGKEEGFGRI